MFLVTMHGATTSRTTVMVILYTCMRERNRSRVGYSSRMHNLLLFYLLFIDIVLQYSTQYWFINLHSVLLQVNVENSATLDNVNLGDSLGSSSAFTTSLSGSLLEQLSFRQVDVVQIVTEDTWTMTIPLLSNYST